MRTEDGRNVVIFGADYSELNVKNLYKALNVAKPDVVLVQLPPNLLLNKFKQRPESFHDNSWYFDASKYL